MPACAIWGAALWLVVPPGCLNPMPDENPSVDNAQAPPTVQRETCDDHPLLVGCGAPDQASPLVPSLPSQGSSEAPAEPDGPDAGGADAGASTDAGSDASR